MHIRCILASMIETPMKPRGIKFPDRLWQAAKEKAGIIPMSVILRRLLEKWVEGKISLD